MNTSPAFLLTASRGQLLWLQKVPAVISIFHANSRWAQQSASHQSNHKEAFVHSVLLPLISPTVATAKRPLGTTHQPLWEYTFSLANSGYIMSNIIRDNTGIHFFLLISQTHFLLTDSI